VRGRALPFSAPFLSGINVGMEFATIQATLKAGDSVFRLGRFGLAYWKKRSRGRIWFTHPTNRSPVTKPTFAVEGRNRSKGRYWLVTLDRDDALWLKTRIALRPDGEWKERINIGNNPGPREVLLLLVWTSDFGDAILQNYKDRSTRLNDHTAPLKLSVSWPEEHFQVVRGLLLEVP
jgi:hypothetical protein